MGAYDYIRETCEDDFDFHRFEQSNDFNDWCDDQSKCREDIDDIAARTFWNSDSVGFDVMSETSKHRLYDYLYR